MPITLQHLWLGLYAIAWREIAKFLRQTERLLSALVRPALWLLVFATGLHDLLGVSIVAPYRTYTPYQEYILPGLAGIVVLFQCMQSALSMVYDREAGVMRVMLVSPLPRGFLLFAKIMEDVGEAFVRTGMGRAYLEQTDLYLAAEEAAKAAELGVWQAGAKVDDPWAWRKRNPGGFR